MKANRILLCALVLMAAPLPLLAQGGEGAGRAGGGQRGGMMSARALLEQGSVEYLVTHAAHLQLSEEQTASFRRIGAAWSAATADVREQVRTSLPARQGAGAAGQGGGAAGGDRQAMMQRMQQLRPVLEKLAADDQKSVDEALALLSATQQAEARKLLEQRAASMRPRRGDG